MTNIEADSINQLVFKSIEEILKNGDVRETRNGVAQEVYDVNLILNNPRNRHLYLDGRTNNIYATLAEMFWVMSGGSEIFPYLSFYIPRAKNYSDDGKTWNASYGDRLFNHKQFHHIFKMFQLDGIQTRRATQSIFMTEFDLFHNYSRRFETMKDIPCNQWINYYVTKKDDTFFLNMKTSQRSGDIIFGTGNINIPEFTLIQEYVLSVLRQLYPNEKIELGKYTHCVTNLHLYDMTRKQGINIVERDNSKNLENPLEDYKCIFPKENLENIDSGEELVIQKFFKEIVSVLTEVIETKEYPKEHIEKIFERYEIPVKNNLLYDYVLSVVTFTTIEALKLEDCHFTFKTDHKDFRNSLISNKFTNFHLA